MLTKAEAERIVDGVLPSLAPRVTGGVALLPDKTITKPYGWIFFYDSKRHIESPSIETAIAGNGPIVVLAKSGEVVALGTARRTDEEIAEFEAARSLPRS